MRLAHLTTEPRNTMQTESLGELFQIFKRMIEIVEDQEKPGTEALVLTVKDVAEQLQVSIPTLRDHFLCRPDFPKIKAGTKYLIPRKALETWLNERGVWNEE